MSVNMDSSSELQGNLIEHYQRARDWFAKSCYGQEISWQRDSSLATMSETRFLSEYAWVVLNSGFREAVIRKHFHYITLCFCDWESANEIWTNRFGCVESASVVFRNRRKLDAIIETAKRLNEHGFDQFKSRIESDPITALTDLPYVGPVTIFHLAKNLGADVAKPDRHLVRVAKRFGYDDVNIMCRYIAAEVGERVSVADLVLWRFEASKRD